MKGGLTLNILAVAIILLIVALIGGNLLSQVRAADIEQYLVSTFTGCGRKDQKCCVNDWCISGLTCSNGKCVGGTTEVVIDKTYLIYDPKTLSRAERDNLFQSKNGIGEKDCSNAINCENCSKIFNFTGAQTCSNCDRCDITSGECRSCLSCDSAEAGNYKELTDCFKCSGCTNIDKESEMADSCSSCSFCDSANVSTLTNGLDCSYCYQCEESIGGKCISCAECGSEPYTTCDACKRTASTTCKAKSDYNLCQIIKECTMNYDGEPCNIEKSIPLPWNNTYSFESTISTILTNCITEDLLKHLTEGGQQKICKFNSSTFNSSAQCICKIKGDANGNCIIDDDDVNICNDLVGLRTGDPDWSPTCDINDDGTIDFNTDIRTIARNVGKTCLQYFFMSDNPSYVPPSNLADMLTSRSVTGENEGILFNDCGYRSVPSSITTTGDFGIYSSYPEIFSSTTTPRTLEGDIPVNLKIMVSNISLNEESDNICKFYIYLCAQEAIATDENDTILDLYGNFSYFNETANVVQTNKWERTYGSTQVNVTGVKYLEFTVDLKDRTYDVQHIAKAIIAGLRDYISMNSYVNQTVEFFCKKSGLHSNINDCYNNNVHIVINDKVPWRLSNSIPADTLSDIPIYKYIYYNSGENPFSGKVDVSLTLFAYTTTNETLNDTIFISPLVVLGHHIPQCSDGKDNDGDGTCDFSGCSGMPADPDCKNDPNVDSESLCKNNVVEPLVGEQCDPPMANSPQCSGNECKADCTCTATCSSFTKEIDCTDAGCYWCQKCLGIYANKWLADTCIDRVEPYPNLQCGYQCVYNSTTKTGECGAECSNDVDCPGIAKACEECKCESKLGG